VYRIKKRLLWDGYIYGVGWGYVIWLSIRQFYFEHILTYKSGRKLRNDKNNWDKVIVWEGGGYEPTRLFHVILFWRLLFSKKNDDILFTSDEPIFRKLFRCFRWSSDTPPTCALTPPPVLLIVKISHMLPLPCQYVNNVHVCSNQSFRRRLINNTSLQTCLQVSALLSHRYVTTTECHDSQGAILTRPSHPGWSKPSTSHTEITLSTEWTNHVYFSYTRLILYIYIVYTLVVKARISVNSVIFPRWHCCLILDSLTGHTDWTDWRYWLRVRMYSRIVDGIKIETHDKPRTK